jgi:hypothetical protein
MILVVNIFSETVVCEVVFLTVKVICSSHSNFLLTKIYSFKQARTSNADQIRYDSLSVFRVTYLHPYNLLFKMYSDYLASEVSVFYMLLTVLAFMFSYFPLNLLFSTLAKFVCE